MLGCDLLDYLFFENEGCLNEYNGPSSLNIYDPLIFV